MKKLYILFIISLSFYGCRELTNFVDFKSPRENYEEKIKKLGVDKTLLGSEWLRAGEKALSDSLLIDTPYREESFFSKEKVEAYGYRINIKQGEKLIINTEKDSLSDYNLFIDLFETAGNELKQVKSSEEKGSVIEYEADKDVILHLRIQPELLAGGRFSLTVITAPTLDFPAAGKNSTAIGSIWGDARDGGKRRHQGVDIFAPKGHPAVASANGLVTRTGTNNLGGKVVWITTPEYSLYYAHLDSQMVTPGSIVSKGDTIGLIGNTGNALTTPPHLHFGIYYRGRGAVNPYPFIDNTDKRVPEPSVNEAVIGKKGSLRINNNLRLSPALKGKKITAVKKGTQAELYGIYKDWYLVNIKDIGRGYLPVSAVSVR